MKNELMERIMKVIAVFEEEAENITSVECEKDENIIQMKVCMTKVNEYIIKPALLLCDNWGLWRSKNNNVEVMMFLW